MTQSGSLPDIEGTKLANTFLDPPSLHLVWGKISVNKELAGMCGGSAVCERDLICFYDDVDQPDLVYKEKVKNSVKHSLNWTE